MIIVDTNVVIAGLLTSTPGATTARIVDDMLVGRLRPLLSPLLLDEYRAVLQRERIRRAHGMTPEQVDELLSSIVQNAIWREPPTASHGPPDPGDNHLWALLEFEPASRLLTGDLRLLDAMPWGERIFRVADYDALKGQGTA